MIYLISGKAQHGKDTFAYLLQQKLPGKTVILHYADHVKAVCRQVYGWDGVKDEAGRKMLQEIGTDKIRARNPKYWVNVVFDLIDVIRDDFDNFIIPDTRFKNEIDECKRRFPYEVAVLRVIRVGFENNLTPEQREHPSETDLDGYPTLDHFIRLQEGIDKVGQVVDYFVEYWVKGFYEKIKEVS
jgi:hypothetical protein